MFRVSFPALSLTRHYYRVKRQKASRDRLFHIWHNANHSTLAHRLKEMSLYPYGSSIEKDRMLAIKDMRESGLDVSVLAPFDKYYPI